MGERLDGWLCLIVVHLVKCNFLESFHFVSVSSCGGTGGRDVGFWGSLGLLYMERRVCTQAQSAVQTAYMSGRRPQCT